MSAKTVFQLCLSLCLGYVLAQEKSLVVTTKQGKVEGELATSGLHYEFLGVRYGYPVKFKAPQEPLSFPGVYKANARTIVCPQFPSNDPLAAPGESEDCLVLNIHVPIGYNTSLPVIAFLHGGGFGVGSGSASFYDPRYIVSHGVIVVTINYRLNVYGFLNLGTKDAPGNAGLKDIRAALRWIKENIKEFGGDPDNVTVFGQGTGGVAAIYLTMSESTKGLFNRVISNSGAPFSPQSFDVNPLGTASQVAKALGVVSEKPEELLKVYSETAIAKVEEAIGKQMDAKSVFLPSVEKIFDGEEAFLTDTPLNILNKGKEHKSFHPVPVLTGLNTVEGLTSTLEYNTITSQIDRIKNHDYSAVDQRNFIVPSKEKAEFRKILKDTYFQNATSDEIIVGGIINMVSDFSYVGPMSFFTDLYANNSGVPVYQYIFNYIGHRNFGRLLTNSSLPATTNLDDLFYLFELERLPLPMDEVDARIVTFMTMMWTNFAKHGSPTPQADHGEWLPHPYHLAVALETQYVAELTPQRAYFWRAYYNKYGDQVEKKLTEEP